MATPTHRGIHRTKACWSFTAKNTGLVRLSRVIPLLLSAATMNMVNISGTIAAEPVPLVAAIIPGSVEPGLETAAIGLNVELIRAAFKKAGLATKIDLLPWRRAKVVAEVGRAAALFTCSHRPDRERHFLYSSKIRTVRTGIYALVRNNSPKIRSLSDIGNKLVGVTAGYNLQDELNDANIASIDAPDDHALVSMLFTKQSEYIYASEDIISPIMKRLNRAAHVRFFSLGTDDLYVCFSRKWPGVAGIAEKFELGLRGIRANGTFDQIINRYR